MPLSMVRSGIRQAGCGEGSGWRESDLCTFRAEQGQLLQQQGSGKQTEREVRTFEADDRGDYRGESELRVSEDQGCIGKAVWDCCES